MAVKNEFERQAVKFHKLYEIGNWDEAIYLGERLKLHFSDIYEDDSQLKRRLSSAYYRRGLANRRGGSLDQAIEDHTKAIELRSNFPQAYNGRGFAYAAKDEYDEAIANYTKAIELKSGYAIAYRNRGETYLKKEEYEKAIADFDKAIELKPDFTKAHSQRADAIGLKAAKRTEEQLLQSYNEQISSVTEPKEIEERFSKRKKQVFERLKSLRSSSDRLSCIIIFTVPLTWALLAYFLFSYCTDGCDTTSFWSLPGAFASLTLATLFLHLPILLRLAHLNRNARIERHVLEDYERKSVMMLLANLKGVSVPAVLRHYKDKGTPEVLNRLYHPKYAYPQKTYEGLLKRLATLITTAIGKDK